jgi:hypothetical protein
LPASDGLVRRSFAPTDRQAETAGNSERHRNSSNCNVHRSDEGDGHVSSHEKAPPTGSTDHRGEDLGHFRASLIRALSEDVRGVGALSSRRSRFVSLFVVGVAVLATFAFGVGGASAAPPTTTISPTVTAGYTTAQVSGTVDPADQETYYGFEYSADPAAEGWSSFFFEGPIAAGAGVQNVSTELSGLKPGTEYQLRLAALNFEEFIEYFSAEPNPTFTTTAAAKPTVSISAATGVTAKTATFHGQINPDAPEAAPASPAVEAAFNIRWRFACNPECPGAEGAMPADDVAHPVTGEVSGLLPGRSYEVRLVGENPGGAEMSGRETFLTPPDPPAVGRAYATAVESTTAAVNAKINPEGAQTSYHFQYATLAEFEAHGFSNAAETAEMPLGTGNSDLVGSAQFTGLLQDTTYVYRPVAINVVETVIGAQGELHTRVPSPPGSACSNEALRIGAAAALPDCRAYEQVTPTQKSNQDGVNDEETIFTPMVSIEGNRAAYFSFGSFAGSPAPNPTYLATSSPTGWSSESIIPRQGVQKSIITACAPQYRAYSPDLSFGILENGINQGLIGCATNEPSIVPTEPQGSTNLFLRDNATGTYQLINVTAPGVTPADAGFEGGSPDLQYVVFNENAPLTPDATGGNMLYEWSAGGVKLIGLIPVGPATSCSGSECTPVQGARIGSGASGFGSTDLIANAVSSDGSGVFFKAAGKLYVRDGNTTTEVDSSHGPGSSGGGKFWTATSDGSSVYFTDTSRLTANASPSGADLYRYEVESDQLTDLTPDSNDTGGAAVQGVLGAGGDGSYLYFVADGVLSTVANSQGESATVGQPNLYVTHGATTIFIGTLAPGGGLNGDGSDWEGSDARASSTSRVTPDGKTLAFNSIRSLTGYDNTDEQTEDADVEVFLYEAESNSLGCPSCNPTGARPIGPSQLEGSEPRLRNTAPNSGTATDNMLLPRNLSENESRLFFDSGDALVPADTNGKKDVYEYENGRDHLISSGSGGDNSSFYGASTSGDDAFFITRDQLVGQDTDGYVDLYDARVDGGIAGQNPPPASPPCSGEACKGSSTAAPAEQSPGSSSFSGPGNQSRGGKPVCKKAQSHHKKCAKKPNKKKQHKKNKHKKTHKDQKQQDRRAK